MGFTNNFNKPDFNSPIDADLDQIRDNYHFILSVAAAGSIVLPGWQTSVVSTSSPQDYGEPDQIILTRGTKRIIINYVWTDSAVSSIQLCYDDGVSSPGLTCYTAQEFFYDDDGNPYGTTDPTASPVFVADSILSAADPASMVIDKPAGTSQGDLLVMIGITRNSLMATPTGGAAWTELDQWGLLLSTIESPISTVNETCKVWYKTAGASEPSTYTVAITDEGTDACVLVCGAWSDATTVTPYDAAPYQDSCPSLTAQEGDTLICWQGVAFDPASMPTQPTGMTKIDGAYLASTDTGLIWAYEEGQSAGATGARDFIGTWDSYGINGSLLIS